ncbi:MAG: Trm112 family protein, partial [Syntrophothermus sp.]
MKRTALEVTACPFCRTGLECEEEEGLDPLLAGALICPRCERQFPIKDGIPRFLEPQALTGFNRHFSRLYDWFSWGYRLFSKVAFAYIGMDEATGRREITDRLDPHGGRVLEVSIGPGVNLPYIIHRPDVGEVFGLDISLGQLKRCQSYVADKGWSVDL